MSAPLIIPRVLPDGELSEELDVYLERIGVRPRDRSTYSDGLFVVGHNLGLGEMAPNLIGMFRNVPLPEYHSTRLSTYGAFTERRASKHAKRMMLERSGVRTRLAAYRPKFVAVDVGSCGDGLMVKGCLALREGLMPYVLADTAYGSRPMSELIEEIGLLGLDLPLVTVRAGATLDYVLRAAPMHHFDHFAIADALWRPADASGVRLAWSDPVGDAIGLGDGLATAPHDNVQVTVVVGRRSQAYLAYGPSSTNRYYMQRMRPQGLRHTAEIMWQRVKAVERSHLTLSPWPVERLVMRSTARWARQRMKHTIVMASGFSLHLGYAPGPDEDLDAWISTYDTWGDGPSHNQKEVNGEH